MPYIAPDHRICIECEAHFKRSRSDSVVRCPDCRAARKPAPAAVKADVDRAAAFAAVRRARREHGPASAEFAAAAAVAARYRP